MAATWSQTRAFRSRVLSMIFILNLDDEEQTSSGHWGRTARFWMRPHLEAREDMHTLNTLDKLERHFLRVSTILA